MRVQFECSGCLKFGERDVFNEGCQLDGGFDYWIDYKFSANTLDQVLFLVRDFVGVDADHEVELDACDELGRIDIQVMENDEGYQPSEKQYQEWKDGKIDLFSCCYSFKISKVTRETISLISGE